ncbi:MAG: hypothetical protein ACO23H_11050 [Alphaproteobacteria bacterium]
MTDRQKDNLKDFDGDNMILTLAIAGLAGLVVGGVSTAAMINKRNAQQPDPAVVVVADPVAGDQQEVIKQLTNLDMLVIPCGAEYIKNYGDLLCREMYCRVMTRGIDSKTSGQECEEISNVANSKIIVDHCESFIEQREECYEKYRERK